MVVTSRLLMQGYGESLPSRIKEATSLDSGGNVTKLRAAAKEARLGETFLLFFKFFFFLNFNLFYFHLELIRFNCNKLYLCKSIDTFP